MVQTENKQAAPAEAQATPEPETQQSPFSGIIEFPRFKNAFAFSDRAIFFLLVALTFDIVGGHYVPEFDIGEVGWSLIGIIVGQNMAMSVKTVDAYTKQIEKE